MARRAGGRRTTSSVMLSAMLAEDRNSGANGCSARREAIPAREPVHVEVRGGGGGGGGTRRGPASVFTHFLWGKLSRTLSLFVEVLGSASPTMLPRYSGAWALYTRSGLKADALLTLESAVQRNPSRFALSPLFAGQLREVGRPPEAEEDEEKRGKKGKEVLRQFASRLELPRRRIELAIRDTR